MELHFFHSIISFSLHSFNLEGIVVEYVWTFFTKKETKLHFQILIESWFVACCHTKLIQNVNLVSIFEVEKGEWSIYWPICISHVFFSFLSFFFLLIFSSKSNKTTCGKTLRKNIVYEFCFEN